MELKPENICISFVHDVTSVAHVDMFGNASFLLLQELTLR